MRKWNLASRNEKYPSWVAPPILDNPPSQAHEPERTLSVAEFPREPLPQEVLQKRENRLGEQRDSDGKDEEEQNLAGLPDERLVKRGHRPRLLSIG